MDGDTEHNEPEVTTNGEEQQPNGEESVAPTDEGVSQDSGPAPPLPDDDDSERPVVELFVKAAVDKMKNGSCPICHRYFLIFYILRERGMIDLVVTTFLPENPPKEVLEFSNGKRYPLVKIHKGTDPSGVDMTGVECDTMDEIEVLVDRFVCDDMPIRRESMAEARAEMVFEDLFMNFNKFLKNTKDFSNPLIKKLEMIDEYLKEKETIFMMGDHLTKADCYLLPTLQHIRVAGKAFKGFEIPTEFTYLWRYLSHAYETDAFKESCPADREIISHYQQKASCPAKIPRKRAELMAEDRTFSVPDAVSAGNGTVAE